MPARLRGRLAWTLVVFGALGAIWLKVRLEAGGAIDRAAAFEAEQDWGLAITTYRNTIRWYSPGSGPVETAVQRLVELGKEPPGGEVELSLMAWRALRSGLYGVRSLYQPYAERIPEANAAIAAIMAAQQGTAVEEIAALEAEHLVKLQRDHAPDPWWSLLAVVAFSVWAFGLFMFAVRAFDDETGRLLSAPAIRWATICLVTMGLWMAGLAWA